MQSDAQGQRHETIIALIPNTHTQAGNNDVIITINTHLFSPGSGSCIGCWSSCWPLSSLEFTEATAHTQRPFASPSNTGRTAGGRAALTERSPSPSSRSQPVTLQIYLQTGVPTTWGSEPSRWSPHKSRMYKNILRIFLVELCCYERINGCSYSPTSDSLPTSSFIISVFTLITHSHMIETSSYYQESHFSSDSDNFKLFKFSVFIQMLEHIIQE